MVHTALSIQHRDPEFESSMDKLEVSRPGFEKPSWLHQGRNYEELIKNVMIAFESLECRVCTKMHCLFSNLNWFLDNLRSMSDGE